MLSIRWVLGGAFASLAALVCAEWTAVVLHPSDATASAARAVTGTYPVGSKFLSNPGRTLAGIWSGTAGTWTSLNPAGATTSNIFGASPTSQVGQAFIDLEDHAGIWTGTASSFLSLHPAGAFSSAAFAVSGSTQVGRVSFGGYNFIAALWNGTASSYVSLEPAGSSSSIAYGVAGSRQVGIATFGGIKQAVLWSGTAQSCISLHPTGASESDAKAMTETIQVGSAVFPSGQHAGYWNGTAASWIDLNPSVPPFGTWSSAAGAAWHHQVGAVTLIDPFYPATYRRACIWSGTASSFEDLHSYLPPGHGIVHSEATGIACDGNFYYVTGIGYPSDGIYGKALLWKKPVTENTFLFGLSKSTVSGQDSLTGDVTLLRTPAISSNLAITDNSALVTTPSSVTIHNGAIKASFPITVLPTNSYLQTRIYARLGAITQSCGLTLAPLLPSEVTFNVSQIKGGSTAQGKVTLTGVAGPNGRVVALFDNSNYSTVPKSVTVPPGASIVTFPFRTSPVTAPVVVTVTARVSAGETTGTILIIP